MQVYFVGAGPGDPELLTVKAARLISTAPVIIYAGSLVPRDVLSAARADAAIYDSAAMDLSAIIRVIKEAHAANLDVVRLHTGDSSIYGSTAEQTRELDQLGIAWQIIPGVSSFSAAAAALGTELTLPEISQTIIITRVEGRTPMPSGERLRDLACHGSTMVIFLSIGLIAKVVDELIPVLGPATVVKIVQKASWPSAKIVEGTLANIVQLVKENNIESTALIFVGGAISHTQKDFPGSQLYSSNFSHGFRSKGDAL